jgi:hypothetical protein
LTKPTCYENPHAKAALGSGANPVELVDDAVRETPLDARMLH